MLEREHDNNPGTIGTRDLIRDSPTGPPLMLSRLRGGPVSVVCMSRAVAAEPRPSAAGATDDRDYYAGSALFPAGGGASRAS
jgi:hypothetical protein